MKVITIKEYIKNYNQLPEEAHMNDYVKSLIKDSKTSDMVEFYNPWFLAGAFSGKFGLLTIENCLKSYGDELKTQAEHYEECVNELVNCHTLSAILKPKNTVFQFISGAYSKKSATPQTKDKYGKDYHRFFTKKPDERILTNNHPHLEIHNCGDHSVSGKGLLISMKEALNLYSKEEVIKAIDDSLSNADRDLERYFSDERNVYPTYELPFRVRLIGNDDSSWSMCYSTEEEAMEVRKEIIKNPTKTTVDKYLVFTN